MSFNSRDSIASFRMISPDGDSDDGYGPSYPLRHSRPKRTSESGPKMCQFIWRIMCEKILGFFSGVNNLAEIIRRKSQSMLQIDFRCPKATGTCYRSPVKPASHDHKTERLRV